MPIEGDVTVYVSAVCTERGIFCKVLHGQGRSTLMFGAYRLRTGGKVLLGPCPTLLLLSGQLKMSLQSERSPLVDGTNVCCIFGAVFSTVASGFFSPQLSVALYMSVMFDCDVVMSAATWITVLLLGK